MVAWSGHSPLTLYSLLNINAQFYLLQHGVGPKLLEDSGVRDTEDPVDDMNDSVCGSDIRGDYCRVHAATFHGHSLVSARSLDHVEVQLLPVRCRGHLQETNES